MAESKGDSFQAEEKKDKSPEDISQECIAIEKKFRIQFQSAVDFEANLLSTTISRLYGSTNKNLHTLGDKVALIANQINSNPGIKVQNKEV